METKNQIKAKNILNLSQNYFWFSTKQKIVLRPILCILFFSALLFSKNILAMRNNDDGNTYRSDTLPLESSEIVIREVPPEESSIERLFLSEVEEESIPNEKSDIEKPFLFSLPIEINQEEEEGIPDHDDLPTETCPNSSDDSTERTFLQRSMLLCSIMYNKVAAIVNPPSTSSSSLPTSSEENESGSNEVLLPFEVSQIPGNHSISVGNDTQIDVDDNHEGADKTQTNSGYIYFGIGSRRL